MGAATDELKREHAEILAMMSVLRGFRDDIAAGHPVPPEKLRATLDFFDVIADQIHHAKEEEILIPALTAKGFPLKGGPLCTYFRSLETIRTSVRDEIRETSRLLGEAPPDPPDAPIPILEEHQLGRNLVRLMTRYAEAPDPGPPDTAGFLRAADRFLEMLAEHIDKEERCLFPMVDATLDNAEQENVRSLMEAFDRRSRRSGPHSP